MVSHIFPYPCCIHAKCFVSLHYYGLDCCILFTPIQAPSMCMILANYRLLSEGCRLCWAAMVVQDGQGHVATSVLHPCQVFWNLVEIWTGLPYHRCTHSISQCCSWEFCTRIWLLPGGSIVCWPTMVVLDGPGHAPISMLHPYKVFVILWCCGLASYTSFTSIQPQVFSWFWPNLGYCSESKLCWAAIVVQDGQVHVAKSMLHPFTVFCNLVVMWMGL